MLWEVFHKGTGTPPECPLRRCFAAPYPKRKRQSLLDCLSLDPRPSYQHDPERIYGMQYAGFDIHFSVNANDLFVTEVIPSHEKQ